MCCDPNFGRETIAWTYLLIYITLTSVLKAVFIKCSHLQQYPLEHSITKMTQNIDYQGCQPLNKKWSDQPNKIVFYRRNYRKVGKIFFSLRHALQNTEKFKFKRSWRLGHNIKIRLTRKYVNAYVFVFISLNNKNDTFVII